MKYIIVLLLTLTILSCENDLKEVQRVAGTLSYGNTESSKYGEILYSDSAKLKVRIKYDTLVRFLDQNELRDVFPKGVNVTFYDENGEPSSILSSKKAERLNKKNLVIATDSVHLVSKNGEELFSNELIWDERSKEIKTDKFVKLTRPGEIIYSYGFKANQEFTKYEIKAISGALKKDNLADDL